METTMTPAPGAPAKKKHNLIASDRVEGTTVCRRKGDRIGTIERLMIDKVTGKVAYAVLSFGGFLGIGGNHLPIPWALLDYNVELDAYEIDLSDEVLKNAPSSPENAEFDYGDRSDEAKLYSYYGTAPYWGY